MQSRLNKAFHSQWLRDSFDELQKNPDVTNNDLLAILGQGIIEYLEKKISLPILLSVITEIHSKHQLLLQPELAEIVTQLVSLSKDENALAANTQQINNLLKMILELIAES